MFLYAKLERFLL